MNLRIFYLCGEIFECLFFLNQRSDKSRFRNIMGKTLTDMSQVKSVPKELKDKIKLLIELCLNSIQDL